MVVVVVYNPGTAGHGSCSSRAHQDTVNLPAPSSLSITHTGHSDESFPPVTTPALGHSPHLISRHPVYAHTTTLVRWAAVRI